MKSEPLKLKNLKSVNYAMWGYYCILSSFLIILIIGIFNVVVAATFTRPARDTVTRIGKEAVSCISAADGNLEEKFFDYRREGVSVFLLSDSGETIIPVDTAAEIPENVLDYMLHRLGNADTGTAIAFTSGKSLNYAAKVEYGGKSGFALATYSLAIINKTVRTINIYLIIVGLLGLVVAFLVSYAFSKKLTRGLKTMSDTAVNLAKGDYSVQFTNADYKEMAQLSDTLNYVRDEVKKSEAFQHEILANVTHDLKTPLTMIKAYASMIKEISGDNPEKREKHLQVIIDEADRLTGLVNDVLSVSKISANLEVINPKVINLTELLYGIINKFGYLQETQGYSFMLDIDKNLYTRADEEKISQVIYNLLGNAANYTGEDKKVYISLKSDFEGKRIKFSVRDTGKGISKEELPDIWNRYYRAKESHTRPVKGSGIGLNIVKVILENHSFDFGVESEEGHGSLFWVDFPSVTSKIEI